MINVKIVQNYIRLIEEIVLHSKEKITLFSTETTDYEVIHEVFNQLKPDIKKQVFITGIITFEDVINL